MLSDKWINYFKTKMLQAAENSKDENTKVGAVIFSEDDKVEISSSWNDLPRGVEHIPERNRRPLKYKFTTHAEANCICNAARMGRSTKGYSIMVSMFPCTMCAGLIINSGIKKVYCPKPDYTHVQYGRDFAISLQMFKEAEVEVLEID